MGKQQHSQSPKCMEVNIKQLVDTTLVRILIFINQAVVDENLGRCVCVCYWPQENMAITWVCSCDLILADVATSDFCPIQ